VFDVGMRIDGAAGDIGTLECFDCKRDMLVDGSATSA
jgi:hypothetical protein